jgi:hypothetical protein
MTPEDAKRIYGGLLCYRIEIAPCILRRNINGQFHIVQYGMGRITWVSEQAATYAEAIEAAEADGWRVEGSSIMPLLRTNDCLFGQHDKCWCRPSCECWCHKVPA